MCECVSATGPEGSVFEMNGRNVKSELAHPKEATSLSDHEVAKLAELPEGKPYPVDVEGTPILLYRQGTSVSAIGATCPHAGAPLAEGIRDGDRLICPWHKAEFCLWTGRHLEPPAVDDLPRYETRLDDGRVMVTLPAISAQAPAAQPDSRVFLIVGAGAAGAVAAQTLREDGFGGRIILLDQVNRVPYDRTLLSKYHLSGQSGSEKTPLQTQSFYQEHRIERCTGKVEMLDAARREVRCADGAVIAYDAALVATGGIPVAPGMPGAHLRNVFVLRSIADADAILAQAERSERVVVIGLGFIGMEVAASLRERGLEVTVVGPEAAPFQKQLGEEVGQAFVTLHRQHGVTFRLGAKVQALEGEREVRSVVLENGERLDADLVVCGFGIRLCTDFLQGVALNEDGSITVDRNLRAADGLYAAGDVARYAYLGQALRVEHWRVAQQHGRVAALSMLGKAEPYEAVPFFWTIQYFKQLDYIGHATSWDRIVLHGDMEKPELLAYYVKDGRVAAAAGLDRGDDTAALLALFRRRQDWTAEELGANPASVLARLQDT
jgi:NADPH-dependent 2,4-dienoyl-CoA reductase/sulfur reductase-like enzyme/nitrite reductase/ring-hydroxylating ferredoxin subunit